jgi:anti-sigma B factor antagonist
MFDVNFDQDGHVHLSGRFDASQQQVALEAFNRITGSTVVDCIKLEYISSAGIGVLLATQKRLSVSGDYLSMQNLSPHIAEIFKYAGLNAILKIQ